MVKKSITEAVTASDPKTKRWRSTFGAARMAYEVGELRQAETLLARATEMANDLPDRSFAQHATAIGAGAVLIAQKRTKEAASRLDKAIAHLDGSADDNHQELLAVALRFKAQALIDSGDEREAEKQLKKSAEILRKLGPDASVQLAYTLSDLCALYLTQGRQSEAERDIKIAIQIADAALGVENPEYRRADMIYQACLPMADDTRMEVVADGITKLQYLYGSKHPNIARALDRYFDALIKRGDEARLEEAQQRFGVSLKSKK